MCGASRLVPIVSWLAQRAGIIVDEKGTEAWAATGEFIALGIEPPPPPIREFRADHPFLFLIRERRNGTILFMGRVNAPGE